MIEQREDTLSKLSVEKRRRARGFSVRCSAPMIAPQQAFGTTIFAVEVLSGSESLASALILLRRRWRAVRMELMEPERRRMRSVVPGKYSRVRESWMRAPL